MPERVRARLGRAATDAAEDKAISRYLRRRRAEGAGAAMEPEEISGRVPCDADLGATAGPSPLPWWRRLLARLRDAREVER